MSLHHDATEIKLNVKIKNWITSNNKPLYISVNR